MVSGSQDYALVEHCLLPSRRQFRVFFLSTKRLDQLLPPLKENLTLQSLYFVIGKTTDPILASVFREVIFCFNQTHEISSFRRSVVVMFSPIHRCRSVLQVIGQTAAEPQSPIARALRAPRGQRATHPCARGRALSLHYFRAACSASRKPEARYHMIDRFVTSLDPSHKRLPFSSSPPPATCRGIDAWGTNELSY